MNLQMTNMKVRIILVVVFFKISWNCRRKGPSKLQKNFYALHFGIFGDESSSSDEDSSDEAAGITKVSVMAGIEPVFNVPVERDPLIQEQRIQLPIFAEEQSIMEAIKGNPVVIICGETGSGKTTQVPQFLYEAGYGNPDSPIQAWLLLPSPVVLPLSVWLNVLVPNWMTRLLSLYQIRYDSTTVTPRVSSNSWPMVFFTWNPVWFLAEQIFHHFIGRSSWTKFEYWYSGRSLSRIVKLRWKKSIDDPKQFRPLRLVIMSATLNVEEFSKPSLFNPLPPVLRVEAVNILSLSISNVKQILITWMKPSRLFQRFTPISWRWNSRLPFR